MAKLIYVSNVSLDGYIEDEHGSFVWTAPDDELFAFVTDLVWPVGIYLYGRRLYETTAPWETEPALAAQSELMADLADVWQAADKVVYSTTLDAVSTAKTRLEGTFDPGSVRDMKASATSDLMRGAHISRRRLSRPGSSMSAICSSAPSSSAQANPRCPATPAPTSSCWTIADSATVSCTSATASRPEGPPPAASTDRCY